jgi:hypothetical protein
MNNRLLILTISMASLLVFGSYSTADVASVNTAKDTPMTDRPRWRGMNMTQKTSILICSAKEAMLRLNQSPHGK